MRRFVTYLYEYDKGNRGKNGGFVRIDVRNEEVQMEVHLRNCLCGGEKGTMYLLVRENEQIFGIEMGEIAITNGRGERVFTFFEQNMEQSGYSFEQVIGIGMRCEKEGYFASNWTDEEYEELTTGSFSVIRHSTNVSAQQAHIEKDSSFTLSNTSYPEILIQEESKKQEDISSVFSLNPSDNKDVIQELSEEENFKDSQNNEYEEEIISEEITPITPLNDILSEYQTTCDCAEEAVIVEKEIIPSSKASIVWWREQIEALLQSDILTNTKSDFNAQDKKTWNADCFTQTYSEDIPRKRCSYQKITVSDIRNLPSPNWYLCNNNFLLHGFFNYEYLIIKKEKINDKERFYLGVPGVFEKQEKAMAMMFGFPYFECCSLEELESQQEFEQIEKKEEPKEGDFGCWYLLLNL